jgi:adenosylhomocysteine nucleosidase
MLLISAAMNEELGVARELLGPTRRITHRGFRLYETAKARQPVYLLKSGVGPYRTQARLATAIRIIRPSLILIIGYAGALDRRLKLGEVVLVRPSSLLPEVCVEGLLSATFQCEGTWDLPGTDVLMIPAGATGTGVQVVPGLTAPRMVGDPFEKSILHRRFGASLIDMETAVAARVAQAANVPAACARAITDTAEDELLKPFSFRSQGGMIRTFAGSLSKREALGCLREWNRRTALARGGLRRFLTILLREFVQQ